MNFLFKKPGGFFVMLLLVMSAHAAFDKHKLKSVVPSLKSSVLSALSEQEQELYRICKPDPVPCFQIQDKIKSIKKDIRICCDGLEEKIDEIIKTVNSLEFCESPTVINQDFMNSATPQITQSGVYCLIEDVTGSLVIDADDVIVRMNDHTISAVGNAIEVTGHKDIFVQGSGTLRAGNMFGMLVTTCTNVSVERINFEENGCGLQFTQVSGIRVSDCLFNKNTNNQINALGLFIQNSQNAKVTDCTFTENITTSTFGPNPRVCIIDDSSDVVFINVHLCNNLSTGILDVEGSSNCIFRNCSSNNNTINLSGGGIVFVNSSDCSCCECQANRNIGNIDDSIGGFVVTSSCTDIIFASCEAMNNDNLNIGASAMALGFDLSDSTACCIVDSLAKINKSTGIRLNACLECRLVNNISVGNDKGYENILGNNNIFFGNYGNQNTTMNFDVTTDFAPTFTFNSVAGTFNPVAPRIAPVTKWDNIAVDKQ